ALVAGGVLGVDGEEGGVGIDDRLAEGVVELRLGACHVADGHQVGTGGAGPGGAFRIGVAAVVGHRRLVHEVADGVTHVVAVGELDGDAVAVGGGHDPLAAVGDSVEGVVAEGRRVI